MFIQQLGMRGLLSFPGDMAPVDLQPLNVLIGPNGSGKSNVIEVLELLRAIPTDFAAAFRDGRDAGDWIWNGENPSASASINIQTGGKSTGLKTPTGRPLRYGLEFTPINGRMEVIDEAVEEVVPGAGEAEPYFYYRFLEGYPAINVMGDPGRPKRLGSSWLSGTTGAKRHLRLDGIIPDQSVLAQRKEPELYPELTWIGRQFEKIQTFREWTFGRHGALRQPQPVDLPEDRLLPDNRNLTLLLNRLEHQDQQRFNGLLRRFLPRFERMSTAVSGGAMQFHLHETGVRFAMPPTRLSDGTIRFIAILATLLAPEPPPLVCIEQPELGLHPDAVALIGELLIEASERMQLIVTTHSDALVSALTNVPEAVVACERPVMGTTLTRLDPERLSQWLDEYCLGDLWRMGELGANP